MLTLQAPAKINLTLEVLRCRPDGYHEIRSVLQTVDLYDTLRLEASEGIIITGDMFGWSLDKSLLSKTILMLKRITGYTKGVNLNVEKRIPMMSGLGGDSSDAAALLRGLDKLWGLGLFPEKLYDLAGQLGSDVAYFLNGGTALAEGRGEIIKPLPVLERMWVVLVVPDVPREFGKTGRMYASLKTNHYTDGDLTAKLTYSIHNTGRLNTLLLFNTFENFAFDSSSSLSIYKEHLLKLGAPHVHLAGSGPALFVMLPDKTSAADLHAECKAQGMETYLAETL